MTTGRRRALVRLLSLLGACSQVLVGLMSPFVLVTAFLSAWAALTAMRHVRRDLETASLRAGVALLVSSVGLWVAVASGALPLLVSALLSTVAFATAWWHVQELSREHRAAFGIRHGDWVRRNAALHRRREEAELGPLAADRDASD